MHDRGIALGVTMMGIGLAGAIIPPHLGGIIATHGWRAGYYALADRAAGWCRAHRIDTAEHRRPRQRSGRGARGAGCSTDMGLFKDFLDTGRGLRRHVACPSRACCRTSCPCSATTGSDPVAAGKVAGQIGLAVIASRLVIGLLLDRVFAPRIAIAMCLIAAAGCAAMPVPWHRWPRRSSPSQ